jgi:hypothetical protein
VRSEQATEASEANKAIEGNSTIEAIGSAIAATQMSPEHSHYSLLFLHHPLLSGATTTGDNWYNWQQ